MVIPYSFHLVQNVAGASLTELTAVDGKWASVSAKLTASETSAVPKDACDAAAFFFLGNGYAPLDTDEVSVGEGDGVEVLSGRARDDAALSAFTFDDGSPCRLSLSNDNAINTAPLGPISRVNRRTVSSEIDSGIGVLLLDSGSDPDAPWHLRGGPGEADDVAPARSSDDLLIALKVSIPEGVGVDVGEVFRGAVKIAAREGFPDADASGPL